MSEAQKVELRELMEVKLSLVKAEVTSGNDIIISKLDEVINHQKKTNGRVTKLEEDIKAVQWIKKNPKLSIIISAAFIFAVTFITDLETFMKIVKFVT
jgi:hypothetical protein